MSSESKLVVELWDYFRDMLSTGKRQDAATHLLRLFREYGIEVEDSEIEGEDEYLDEAILALHEEDDSGDHDDDYNSERE